MALTHLQKDIMRAIAGNRTETSYLAGGVVLNMDWPRISDDIDIFHDTDEEIGAAAEKDMRTLRENDFGVTVEVMIYGCVEAIISRNDATTVIQWMSESRSRFFPVLRDEIWGTRLHSTDLAINKALAASTRRKARDMVDLVTISERMAPLGPIFMAAAGKPPHYSPMRIVDEIRHRGMSMPSEDLLSVRGVPEEWNATIIRDKLSMALDQAETYILKAPVELAGLLAADKKGLPVEVSSLKTPGVEFRKAATRQDPIPAFPDAAITWDKQS